MNFENILLILLIFYVAWRLYQGIHMRRDDVPKLRLVSKKTGQVIEVNLLDEKGKPILHPVSTEESFSVMAKDMFTRIVYAFMEGKVDELKTLVSPKVLRVFQQAIDARTQNNQHMDFTLVDFKEVKLLESSSDNVQQVAFTTEQINLLKDSEGNVISGDPLYITTVNEVWTFEQQGNKKWQLVATKQGAHDVA